MKRSTLFGGGAMMLSAMMWVGGCTQAAPKHEAEAKSLAAETTGAIDSFKATDPSMQQLLDKSVGYAVFPDVGKGGLIAGGSYGKGEVFEHGRKVGYCDLSQATIGLALGGQAYSELIAFETAAALEKFKSGNFAFSAQASAVALKSGATANAKYTDGVAVFTTGEAGLMYEASIGGQKFSYKPL